MENLFYSHHEGITFFIAGYTDNSQNVKDIISMLQNNFNSFEKIVKTKQIKTDLILESSRYKQMRVFWAETGEKIPVGAFVIGKNQKEDDVNKWTMHKWLAF